MANYLVVLFKDKRRKKIINKFLTFERANKLYDSLVEDSKKVVFEKEVSSGKKTDYELGLIQVGKNPENRMYLKDEFGRNISVKIEEDNMVILKISPIKIEEEVFDYQQKKKINFESFLKKYLKGPNVKLVSGLNNKVIVQDEDNFNLFTLKNDQECNRFLDCLSNYLFSNKRMDCLIVKDSSMAQKKYLYELLESKGYDKQFLYRKFTSQPL